jgi:tetratricopeptide (TPR) repeat protein
MPGAESRLGRDDLIAALAARIENCLRIGPKAVLGPDALDEARQLAERIGSRYTCDAEAVMFLATFHLHRWRALPDGDDAWDAELMTTWLAVAAKIDPNLVPPPLRSMTASRAPREEIDVAALNAGAAALAMRYEQTGDAELLDRGIALWQRALDQLRCDQRAPRAGILINLSAALTRRSETSQSRVDADEAVAAAREAVRVTPRGHELHGNALAHLGVALTNRFELSGHPADLTEAITTGRGAVGSEYQAHPGRPKFLSNLAKALRFSFESTGRLADLDEAVTLNREAVSAAASSDAVAIRTNLAGILQMRFEATWERAHIEEAVDLGRATVLATPPGHPDLAGRLYNLGGALQSRAMFLARPDHIPEIVETARRAVAAMTDDHRDRPMYLSNLAAALRLRLVTGSAVGSLDAEQRDRDLAEMVQAARLAVERTPADHPARAGYLNNLGVILRLRGTATDLDQAVAVAREAVATTPRDHHNWCPHMSNLGNALEERFRRTRQAEDFGEAISAWAEAAKSETGAAQVRLAAAIAWGRLAAAENDTASAADGFAQGVSLLPIVAWRGLERAVREENLARWRGLASDAAAWAIRNGEPERAVEVLEQGRSVLWTQQLHMRTEADRLADLAPDLHEALEETRRALDSTGRRDITGRGVSPDPEQAAAQHRRHAELWDLLVAQVRELPGLEDFLAAVPFGKLSDAAAGGPVVIVNTSSFGCDALVVTGKGVRVIPLPALDHDEVVSRTQSMLAVLDRAIGGEFAALDETLISVLGWLWTTVACPVLDALNLKERLNLAERDAVRACRLWWCPTGALAMLPLHAAGIYGTENTAVPDRVISSYAPTLTALARSRERHAEGFRTQLLVGVQDAPGEPSLPSVPVELERVKKHVKLATTLQNGQATRARVLEAMAVHDWVHLVCHGRQDVTNPADSSIRVADGPLTIFDIAGRTPSECDLAYLSACQTFTGAPRLPDEAIHLASAFQIAGYRHVIATLWAINDFYAPRVAESVYRTLSHNGVPHSDRAAEAIHQAVAELRKRAPGRPHLWAPYVHIGP